MNITVESQLRIRFTIGLVFCGIIVAMLFSQASFKPIPKQKKRKIEKKESYGIDVSRIDIRSVLIDSNQINQDWEPVTLTDLVQTKKGQNSDFTTLFKKQKQAYLSTYSEVLDVFQGIYKRNTKSIAQGFQDANAAILLWEFLKEKEYGVLHIQKDSFKFTYLQPSVVNTVIGEKLQAVAEAEVLRLKLVLEDMDKSDNKRIRNDSNSHAIIGDGKLFRKTLKDRSKIEKVTCRDCADFIARSFPKSSVRVFFDLHVVSIIKAKKQNQIVWFVFSYNDYIAIRSNKTLSLQQFIEAVPLFFLNKKLVFGFGYQ